MKRYYEEELPHGYTEASTVDANDKKSSLKIRIASLITSVALINVFFFSYVLPRINEFNDSFGFVVLKIVGFVILYMIYIILHELTHGLIYKIFTKKKLTFDFKPPAASCGVPDIYVYRVTSLLSLFAPLTLFSIVFAVLFFVISDPLSKALIFLLFTFHISGCSGDIYSIGLFLFKFKDPATLRKDTGPKQIYYTKG